MSGFYDEDDFIEQSEKRIEMKNTYFPEQEVNLEDSLLQELALIKNEI
ncbi:hypothetical protein KA405_00750 [Patescibacteria group bacterium]|nr:hypothetical protein [Patescibacteria group bacterium]